MIGSQARYTAPIVRCWKSGEPTGKGDELIAGRCAGWAELGARWGIHKKDQSKNRQRGGAVNTRQGKRENLGESSETGLAVTNGFIISHEIARTSWEGVYRSVRGGLCSANAFQDGTRTSQDVQSFKWKTKWKISVYSLVWTNAMMHISVQLLIVN